MAKRVGGMGRDSFCGCSIPTVFNQRWIFLKRDQIKQEEKSEDEEARGMSMSTFGGRQFSSKSQSLHKVVQNILNRSTEYISRSFSVAAVKGLLKKKHNRPKGKEMKVDLRKKIECAYMLS